MVSKKHSEQPTMDCKKKVNYTSPNLVQYEENGMLIAEFRKEV